MLRAPPTPGPPYFGRGGPNAGPGASPRPLFSGRSWGKWIAPGAPGADDFQARPSSEQAEALGALLSVLFQGSWNNSAEPRGTKGFGLGHFIGGSIVWIRGKSSFITPNISRSLGGLHLERERERATSVAFCSHRWPFSESLHSL